jgi:hypothetical protein
MRIKAELGYLAAAWRGHLLGTDVIWGELIFRAGL